MSLKDILDEKIIATDLSAETKEQALMLLSQMLLNAEYITDIPSFLKDIYYRESLGATGIGNYIAIPHGQSESVVKNGIAIGKFSQEIPWESLDGKGVQLIFLFSVNVHSDGASNHLKMLAALAGKLGNDDVVDQLLRSSGANEIKQIFLQ